MRALGPIGIILGIAVFLVAVIDPGRYLTKWFEREPSSWGWGPNANRVFGMVAGIVMAIVGIVLIATR